MWKFVANRKFTVETCSEVQGVIERCQAQEVKAAGQGVEETHACLDAGVGKLPGERIVGRAGGGRLLGNRLGFDVERWGRG